MTKELSPYRTMIASVERAIRVMPGALGADPFPLEHSFADGLYIRKITIPAGYFIVGKLHRDSYVSFVERGDMSILTENGVVRVYEPTTQISPSGTKRFGFSHEETVWVTVHNNPDNERDIEKLENMIHEDEGGEIPCENIPFEVKKFRELTDSVFSKEKYGFYNDWTEEQKALFDSGDWEAFSRSRGYSDEEIEELREWIMQKEDAESRGIHILALVSDIISGYALRNIMQDTRGEILLSSKMPTIKKAGELCQE